MFISPPPASTEKCTCPPKAGWGNEQVHVTTNKSCPINGQRDPVVGLHSADWLHGNHQIKLAHTVHPITSSSGPEREWSAVVALLHSIPIYGANDLPDFLEGVAEGLREIRKEQARDLNDSTKHSAGDGGLDR